MSPPDLAAFLGKSSAPLLLIVDDLAPGLEDLLTIPVDGTVVRVSELSAAPEEAWRSVVLATRDRASLRAVVAGLPMIGRVRSISCWIAEGSGPLLLQNRPEWPALVSLNARATGDRGFVTVARFRRPAPVVPVLVELARQAVFGHETTNGGLVVGRIGGTGLAGIDPGAVVASDPDSVAEQERDVPPDVVLSDADLSLPVHHVLDRAPTVVTDPGLAPVDEMVINPIGFDKDWDQPLTKLIGSALRLTDGTELELTKGLTEHALASLRDVQGVEIEWSEQTPVSGVLGLAMAGIPVTALPAEGRQVEGLSAALGTPLTTALLEPVDLDDPLAREEHSVQVRRAALDQGSTLAWRARLAARAGVRFQAHPPVSLLLATKRPEQLDFALRQLGRQRNADYEVVLAAHGFKADAGRARDAFGDGPLTLLSFEESTLFGDVLAAAAQASSGEVMLKVDDDDWYAPDVIHDLLLARRYSGAEVVGMPAEFVFLGPLDLTVRRSHPVEQYTSFVAGGTLMVDRGLLRAVGDFRAVRRFVDAQLLRAAEAAGARIYRTHGLGYILRRGEAGHTWARDPEGFRPEGRVAAEWHGFHPSRLMEVDPRDHP